MKLTDTQIQEVLKYVKDRMNYLRRIPADQIDDIVQDLAVMFLEGRVPEKKSIKHYQHWSMQRGARRWEQSMAQTIIKGASDSNESVTTGDELILHADLQKIINTENGKLLWRYVMGDKTVGRMEAFRARRALRKAYYGTVRQ